MEVCGWHQLSYLFTDRGSQIQDLGLHTTEVGDACALIRHSLDGNKQEGAQPLGLQDSRYTDSGPLARARRQEGAICIDCM